MIPPSSGCARTRCSTPERRVQRLLKALPSHEPTFDPYAILAALERQATAYVVVGGFGRVVQGAEETTDGVDIAPSLRDDNLRRLALALDDLGAAGPTAAPVTLDEGDIHEPPPVEFRSAKGELKIVAEPAGTRGGYDDLRRAPHGSQSARASASRSPRPPTSPACSPHSDVKTGTAPSLKPAAGFSNSTNVLGHGSTVSLTTFTGQLARRTNHLDSQRDTDAPRCRSVI